MSSGQALKHVRADRTDPVHLSMQRSIRIGLAARIINKCLEGVESVTQQQERVALAIYHRTVPALAAVSVQVTQADELTFHDVSAMLLSSGVDPSQLWDSLEAPLIGESDRVDSQQDTDDEPAHTPAREAEPQATDNAQEKPVSTP